MSDAYERYSTGTCVQFTCNTSTFARHVDAPPTARQLEETTWVQRSLATSTSLVAKRLSQTFFSNASTTVTHRIFRFAERNVVLHTAGPPQRHPGSWLLTALNGCRSRLAYRAKAMQPSPTRAACGAESFQRQLATLRSETKQQNLNPSAPFRMTDQASYALRRSRAPGASNRDYAYDLEGKIAALIQR